MHVVTLMSARTDISVSNDFVSTGEQQWRNREATPSSQKAFFLIGLAGLGFARPKTAPHCFQALSLFIEIINFFVAPRQFGFRRILTSQLIKRLTDGKLCRFSHDSVTFSIKGYARPNQP